ncbi:hypothetical protein VNO80_25686 [Phaseolus coccineus]|uniref:Uncharacterized protein n=1 Tax=Phaseolus coccineus TaxID=3886 RepID=A0AAN9LUM8_PHACN
MMDLRFKNNNWVGNMYQKFEAVCQEVDDIVCQDAVKYLENQVHNVGDSVKKFYSGVVHELLPFNSLASSKYEDHLLVAETNNIDFSVDSVESVACCKDNNKKRDEKNPINNYYLALMDSNAIDIADYKQAGVLANEESDESCSVSLELEDSCITQEEVGNDSRGTSESKNENFHTSFEEIAVESVPKPMDLMSVGDKESQDFSIHSESSSDTFVSGCEVSIRKKVDIDVNPGKISCLTADENVMNSSTSHVLSSQSLDDSNAIDTADIQNGGVHIRHTSEVSDESCSVSLDVVDSHISQEEVDDDSRRTSVSTKETIHTSIEEDALESVPKPLNKMSVGDKESLEFPIHSEPCSDSFDYKVSIRTKDNRAVNPHQNSCLIVEEKARNPSMSEVLSSQSLGEEESINVSLFSKSSNADQNTHGIPAEVSPDVSVSSERPVTRTEPSCSSSSLTLGSLYSKQLNESCKSNPGDATLCISDGFKVHTRCESSTHLAGLVMEPQGCLVFSGYFQSMESEDKSLVSSIESCMEVIQLNDDPKLEKRCINVDDGELHAVAFRTRKLRSYKKRIQDAFTSKKRLSKEYEQLAIWYGDCDIEPRQDFSETLFPLSTRTNMESKNVEEQHDSETEWELL